jgi:hypothetical protein
MFRIVVMATSICILALTYIHHVLGGLILGYHKDGTVWFSNELVSSGGDDSFGIIIGFGSFLITLMIFAIKKSSAPYVYYVNLLFVYFILFLINLDVSVIGSIQYGDDVLAALLLLLHIPVIYHLTSVSWSTFRPTLEKQR